MAVVFSGLVLMALLLSGRRSEGQSSQVNAPAPLQKGVNEGTLDSEAGAQYWDLHLDPGSFQLVFSAARPTETFDRNNLPVIKLTLRPEAKPGAISQRPLPDGGTVYQGIVTERTYLHVAILPPRSAPDHIKTDYVLVARGDVDFEDHTGK